MGVGVVWIFVDRFEQLFLGGFLPTFLARSDSKIIVRGRAFRIDSERLRQFGQRAVEFGLSIINDAERSVREFVVRRQCHRLFQHQLRRLEFAGAKIDDPEVR